MHYKNGREAHDGDPVITKDHSGKVVAGVLHSTIPGSDTCNGQIATAYPGGVNQLCVSIKDCYHAEDAWNAIKVKVQTATATTGIVDLPAT